MSGRQRCAIYTRKSTDEGLEQEFNSLDAQREACEAYVRSQAGEGWRPIRTRYDDGGISGGTMDRPALQALLADIQGGRIDTVVVYKVDRLTRSLADFSKIVDVFDEHGVAFVSVTQQFNTTTSMGRLTLNMLLSFAQFEREVTGERIRDKIAASKKKGMWMGGPIPLGYDVMERKLIVNPSEAETIRTLFGLYLDHGTVKRTLAAANDLGLVTKRRQRPDGRKTGGRPFTRGHLYRILSNPLYVGDISHKGATHIGQHEAIVGRETFEAVQRQLDANAVETTAPANGKAPSLLTGLVFDKTGDRLSPTHANKRGRRYRYYISKRLMHRSEGAEDGWRLPARALEDTVKAGLGSFLRNQRRVSDTLFSADADTSPERMRTVLAKASGLSDNLDDSRLLRCLIQRVTVCPGSICIAIDRQGLQQRLLDRIPEKLTEADEPIEVTLPMTLKRRGVEAKLIIGSIEINGPRPDKHLIDLIQKSYLWLGMLARGEASSINEIADQTRIHASDVGRVLQLAFLAPDIVEAIVDGCQPVDLTAKRLKRIGVLPCDWDRQRSLLGIGV